MGYTTTHLKDFLSRFAFRYQDGFFLKDMKVWSFIIKLNFKWDCGLHYIIWCDIMGYIHQLNRIKVRLAILILKKIHENSICHASKNIILILKWVSFSRLLDHNKTLLIVQFLGDKDGVSILYISFFKTILDCCMCQSKAKLCSTCSNVKLWVVLRF